MPGRPGLNPLGHTDVYTVPGHLWPALNELNDVLSLDAHHRRRVGVGFALPDRDGALRLLGSRFVKGSKPRLEQHLDVRDAAGNLAAIRRARETAAVVIASIHSHEMGTEGEEQPAALSPTRAAG